MRKKLFLAALILVLALTGVCGCNKENTSAGNNPTNQKDIDSVVNENNKNGDNNDAQEDIAPGVITAEGLLKVWGNKAAEAAYLDMSIELDLDYLKRTIWKGSGSDTADDMVTVKETLDAKLGEGVFYFNRSAMVNDQGFPKEQVSECWIKTDGEEVVYAKFNPKDQHWYYDETWDSDIANYLLNIKSVFKGLDKSVHPSMLLEEDDNTYVVTAEVDLLKMLALDSKEETYKNDFFKTEFFEKFDINLNIIYTFDKTTGDLISMSLKPETMDIVAPDKEFLFNTFICKLTINEIGNKELDFSVEELEAREDKKDFLDDWYEMDIFNPNLDRIPRALKLVTPEEYKEKTGEISSDWTSMEFFFDGKIHTLGDPVYTLTDTWTTTEEGELDEVYGYASSTVSYRLNYDHELLHVKFFSPNDVTIPNKDRHIYAIEYEGDYRSIVNGEDTCDLQVGTFKIGGNFEEAKGDLGERNKYKYGGDETYQYFSDYGRCTIRVTVDDNIITGIGLYYSNWEY